MGTRSDIIVHCQDDKWRRIYCHWDGYLEGNGRTLFDHYTSQKLAEALVALGDLSILGETIGHKHPFDGEHGTMCAAYGRDRGEENVTATVGSSLAEVWPEQDTWTEFTYVWDENKWWVGDPGEGSQTLIDLGDALLGKKTLKPAVKAFGMVIGQHEAAAPAKDHSWVWHKAQP